MRLRKTRRMDPFFGCFVNGFPVTASAHSGGFALSWQMCARALICYDFPFRIQDSDGRRNMASQAQLATPDELVA